MIHPFKRRKSLGQSTVEYLLMVAVGSLFSIQIVRFFNGIFSEGLVELERNVATEVRTGSGFTGRR